MKGRVKGTVQEKGQRIRRLPHQQEIQPRQKRPILHTKLRASLRLQIMRRHPLQLIHTLPIPLPKPLLHARQISTQHQRLQHTKQIQDAQPVIDLPMQQRLRHQMRKRRRCQLIHPRTPHQRQGQLPQISLQRLPLILHHPLQHLSRRRTRRAIQTLQALPQRIIKAQQILLHAFQPPNTNVFLASSIPQQAPICTTPAKKKQTREGPASFTVFYIKHGRGQLFYWGGYLLAALELGLQERYWKALWNHPQERQ